MEKYQEEYGDAWVLFVRGRRSNPWAVEPWYRVTKRDGRVHKVRVGWVVAVWEWGRCVYLGDHLHPTRPKRDWPHARRPWVYPTRDRAVAALRAWRRVGLVRRWGLLSLVALYR